MKRNRLVFVISGQLTISRTVHLVKLINILKDSFSDIVIIHEGIVPPTLEGEAVRTFYTSLTIPESTSPIASRITNYFVQELRKFILVLRHVAPRDVTLFLGIYQPLSLMAARMRGGYPVQFCGGFDVDRGPGKNRFLEDIFLSVRWALQLALLRFAQRLVFETPSVKSSYNLDKFRTDASCFGSLYVNKDFFFTTPLQNREFDIGFVGLLSREKGVVEFVKSLPIIKGRRRLKALIIGNGYLRQYVRGFLCKNKLEDSVKLVSKVEYENMPIWLNKIKLLVAPSLSEGLNGVLIEAMACGTPVLTTKTGGIADVIRNGATGFFLHSVEPKHIARQVLQLLGKDDLLHAISLQAQKGVQTSFSLITVRKNWQRILEDISKDQISARVS